MEEINRQDIRRLLKRFGVQADEALIAHLARNPDVEVLHLRLVLEDLTQYGASAPAEPLHLEVEGEVTRP
jgi:hypothetical protein